MALLSWTRQNIEKSSTSKGKNKACYEVNDPRLRQVTCLDLEDQFYEVELAKTRIDLDLPVQLRYFILQNAKLSMLQFYYDCLSEYVDGNSFEYIAMDTVRSFYLYSHFSLTKVTR